MSSQYVAVSDAGISDTILKERSVVASAALLRCRMTKTIKCELNIPFHSIQPASLQFVSDLLAFREEKSIIDLMDEKSNSFDNPGASHHQVQVEYIKGLSAIGVCLISFWFLWLLVLAFLKCGGKRIGCASGQPFRSWDRDVQGDHNNIENDGVHQSTSNNTGSRPRVDYLEGLWRYENEQPSFQDIWDEPDDGYEDDLYTTISAGVSTKSSLTHRLRSCCCSDSREQVERRKRRTRWVYFAAFVVVEVTGILLFFYFCYPLVDATTNAGLIIVEGQAIHTEIDQSLTQIRTSLTLVGRLLRNNIPLDNSLQSICPNVDAESEVAALLGNDFQTVLGFLATDYPDVLDSVESDLDVGSSFADALGEALSRSVVVLNETEEKLWILPFLVLSSMIVNWIFGMFFAATVWDGSSSSSSRKDDFRWKYKKAFLLNRILLPIAVVLSSLLFFLSVSMLMGGALASDSCIAGEDRSPDATVEAIIRRQQVSRQMDEFSALTVKAYTVDVSHVVPSCVVVAEK